MNVCTHTCTHNKRCSISAKHSHTPQAAPLEAASEKKKESDTHKREDMIYSAKEWKETEKEESVCVWEGAAGKNGSGHIQVITDQSIH